MNIANKLTVARMFLIPVFIILMYIPNQFGKFDVLGASIPVFQFIAGLVFTMASITDYLDGYLARKHNLITSFGEFFDPMADKLLVITALIMLVQANTVPGWVVVIIVSRELLVTGLRVLLATQSGKVMAAAWPGKIKTFTQMFAIIFYLFDDIGFALLNIPISTILIYICLIFTVYSGAEYFYKGRHVFSDTQ
ncbi:CDP-diacylglycerol--glycerol-3-phosphate 3-phosphatidyltransferase [Aerococcaceae bacterium INB8]|uniref:CDP-diacylglycerol--glycerol-3-phosphate 3-phosphatidyltransferase n=1 Tax=Ruoffia halotolerans TaxID=2748684 RepID=A0A839A559_9LACT|nr:CDP-diacylglycerol--glycerol-3-phosphate 3-phosphatidyltransferase [Ruoffia halotolerans]MBA5729051.1 CDP-diacylglycerol--glycerol-3-phosphate 3-phosphatidyltransferase [Ruoffia halotolerans]